MSVKRTVKIEDLSQEHAQTITEKTLSKIQGGLLLRTQDTRVASKGTIEVESFSWGVTQTGGF